MKLNLDRVLIDLLTDKPIKADADKDADLRFIIINALVGFMEDDKGLSDLKKFENWKLAELIKNANSSVELTIEQVASIKSRIGKMYATSVVGPAFTLIELGE